MMREGIAKHGGYEINTEGDAFQVGPSQSMPCSPSGLGIHPASDGNMCSVWDHNIMWRASSTLGYQAAVDGHPFTVPHMFPVPVPLWRSGRRNRICCCSRGRGSLEHCCIDLAFAVQVAFGTVHSAVLFCLEAQYRLLEAAWPKEVLKLANCREVVTASGPAICLRKGRFVAIDAVHLVIVQRSRRNKFAKQQLLC